MSLIKIIKAQLGLSVTPANNFTLDASADNGTMKLARNSGQDIMTVDDAGKVAFPQNKTYAAYAVSGNSGVSPGLGTPTQFGLTTVVTDPDGAIVGQAYKPRTPGWYWVYVNASYASNGIVASNLNAFVMKNGATYANVGQNACPTLGYPGVGGGVIVYLNGTTDYVNPATSHTASGAATCSMTLSAFLIKAS